MVLSGLTMTPQRNMQVAFVGPYLVSGMSMLTKSKTMAQAAQGGGDRYRRTCSVAALRGSTAEKFAEDEHAEGAKLMLVDTLDEGVEMVREGKVDALLADHPFCMVSVYRYRDDLATLDTPFTFEPLGIALPPNDPLLINWTQNALADLDDSGAIFDMMYAWFEEDDWVERLRCTRSCRTRRARSARAVLWDMDGTLVDSGDCHFAAWRETMRELGRDAQPRRVRRPPSASATTPSCAAWSIRRSATAEIAPHRRRQGGALSRPGARRGIAALPGAREWLARLARRRLATGDRQLRPARSTREAIIDALGWRGAFDAVVAAEDVTHGKPHPEVFLAAAARLGVAPRALRRGRGRAARHRGRPPRRHADHRRPDDAPRTSTPTASSPRSRISRPTPSNGFWRSWRAPLPRRLWREALGRPATAERRPPALPYPAAAAGESSARSVVLKFACRSACSCLPPPPRRAGAGGRGDRLDRGAELHRPCLLVARHGGGAGGRRPLLSAVLRRRAPRRLRHVDARLDGDLAELRRPHDRRHRAGRPLARQQRDDPAAPPDAIDLARSPADDAGPRRADADAETSEVEKLRDRVRSLEEKIERLEGGHQETP